MDMVLQDGHDGTTMMGSSYRSHGMGHDTYAGERRYGRSVLVQCGWKQGEAVGLRKEGQTERVQTKRRQHEAGGIGVERLKQVRLATSVSSVALNDAWWLRCCELEGNRRVSMTRKNGYLVDERVGSASDDETDSNEHDDDAMSCDGRAAAGDVTYLDMFVRPKFTSHDDFDKWYEAVGEKMEKSGKKGGRTSKMQRHREMGAGKRKANDASDCSRSADNSNGEADDHMHHGSENSSESEEEGFGNGAFDFKALFASCKGRRFGGAGGGAQAKSVQGKLQRMKRIERGLLGKGGQNGLNKTAKCGEDEEHVPRQRVRMGGVAVPTNLTDAEMTIIREAAVQNTLAARAKQEEHEHDEDVSEVGQRKEKKKDKVKAKKKKKKSHDKKKSKKDAKPNGRGHDHARSRTGKPRRKDKHNTSC